MLGVNVYGMSLNPEHICKVKIGTLSIIHTRQKQYGRLPQPFSSAAMDIKAVPALSTR